MMRLPPSRPGRRRPSLGLDVAVLTVVCLLASWGAVYQSRPAAHPVADRPPRPASSNGTPRRTVPDSEPGGGSLLFPTHRLDMYNGAAGTPALGVLGAAPPQAEWPRLIAASRQYDRPNVVTVPAYELIVWLEQSAPGPDGSYTVRAPEATIANYYRVVHGHHGMLVLDVQPGRGDFLPLAKTLTRWLAKPDVGLALDPEWKLYANQVPDQQIGYTDAASVNRVSAWLSALVATNHLPQKLLLVHNFTGLMLHDEQHLAFYPNLALAENADGFGSREDKLSHYRLLAADPRMWLGFKLFYRQDVDMYSPAEVLAMPHPPSIIDYQ